MAAPYTLKRLSELEDSAARFGVGEHQEARFAKDDLEAKDTAMSYHRVRPSKRQGFAHRHDDAEEIYVVVAGSGRVKLDDDIVELEPLDALRVDSGVTRQFEAGSDGLDLLAFGQRRDGDGEVVPDWWTD
ncbi:MAG: cupin domain-containing protein [Thermoleophilaceae bacterium]